MIVRYIRAGEMRCDDDCMPALHHDDDIVNHDDVGNVPSFFNSGFNKVRKGTIISIIILFLWLQYYQPYYIANSTFGIDQPITRH